MAANLSRIEQLPLELCRAIQEDLTIQDLSGLLQCSKNTRRIWEPELYNLGLVRDHCLVHACQHGDISLYELLLRYGVHPMTMVEPYRSTKRQHWNSRYTTILEIPYWHARNGTFRVAAAAPSPLAIAARYQQLTLFKYMLRLGALSMFDRSSARYNLANSLTTTMKEPFLKVMIELEPHERLVEFFSLTRFPLATLILCGASTALLLSIIDAGPDIATATRVNPSKTALSIRINRDPDARRRHFEYTPLQAAMVAGSPEILQLLLDHGAGFPDNTHQDKHCPRHEPRTPFYFCAITQKFERMAETFDICLDQGANINEFSYWPIVVNSSIHYIIMTPLFEYIFSLPLDIWTSDKAWQVLEVLNLFVESGALLDPANDKDFIKNCTVEISPCTKNWIINFSLARWGVATLIEPPFFAFVEFLFQNAAAKQFKPAPRIAVNQDQTYSSVNQGNMKLTDLVIRYRAPHLDKHELQYLSNYIEDLDTPGSAQAGRSELKNWRKSTNALCKKATNTPDETIVLCAICAQLAAKKMEAAQILQAELWKHRHAWAEAQEAERVRRINASPPPAIDYHASPSASRRWVCCWMRRR